MRSIVGLSFVLAASLLAVACAGAEPPERVVTVTETAAALSGASAEPSPEREAPVSPTPSEQEVSGGASPSPSPTKESDRLSCLEVNPAVTLLNKEFQPWSFGTADWIRIELAMDYVNTCSKAVKAVKGDVYVFDAFGDQVLKGDWKESLSLPQGGSGTGIAGYGYQFSNQMPEGIALLNTRRQDLTVRWVTQEVVLAGGQRLP